MAGTKALINTFTRVKNLEYDKFGVVEDWLDSQFTVNYDDGTFGFLFYADCRDTWEPLDEIKGIGPDCIAFDDIAKVSPNMWFKVAPPTDEEQQFNADMDALLAGIDGEELL